MSIAQMPVPVPADIISQRHSALVPSCIRTLYVLGKQTWGGNPYVRDIHVPVPKSNIRGGPQFGISRARCSCSFRATRKSLWKMSMRSFSCCVRQCHVSVTLSILPAPHTESELTSSHGYMYIPLRKPWNSRPFSVWFLGTGTGTFPLLSN